MTLLDMYYSQCSDSSAPVPGAPAWGGTLMMWVILAISLSSAPAVGQTITIDEARSEPIGTSVTIEGTVTRAFGAYVRVQDDSGPTGASAIVVRQTFGDLSEGFQSDIANGTIAAGTQLQLTGSTSEFSGLLQINNTDLTDYQVQGQGTVPAPQSVTLSDLATNGEDYESELVAVPGIEFPSASGTFSFGQTYTVTDGTTSLDLRVQTESETETGGSPIPESPVDYEGVIGQFNADYQLIPIRSSDIPVPFFELSRTFADSEEGSESVDLDIRAINLADGVTASVTATVRSVSTADVSTDISGFSGTETFQFTGPDPVPQTITFQSLDDSETEGLERLEIELSSPDILPASDVFTLWIRDDATAQGTIAAGETGLTLTETLQATYGGAPTLEYENPGTARDTLFSAVYEARGDSLRGVYTGFARFIPEDADPTVAACNFDAQNCTDVDDINTEHAWPQSLGAGEMPAQGDMHILFPARGDVNGARSNFPFGNVSDADADEWFLQDLTRTSAPMSSRLWSKIDDAGTRSESRFEPRDSVKGDIARAMFYFVTMYPNRANLQFYNAQAQTLFQWHQDDPADAAEVRRNIIKASYQGNKINPFIVDPTLVDRAYFSGGGTPTPTVISIADARQEGDGATVTVQGVVTRLTDDGPYIQDDTGGLYVFESQGAFGSDLGADIQVGTELQVSGSLTFFNGLLELTDVGDSQYSVVSQGNALPDPALATLNDLALEGERYESELVRVENIEIDPNGDTVFQESTNYSVTDPSIDAVSDAVTLRIPGGSPLAGIEIPVTATFVGALGQFNGEGFGADEPDTGYQLLGLATTDLQAPVTTIPDETTLDVAVTFGSTGATGNYRLVGLAGQGDRSLASTLSGAPGIEWTAFRDTGGDQDFLQPYDGSDAFNLRPGSGFWLLSASDWTVAETVPTVDVSNDATTIPLQDGWNIISNPLPVDIAWSAVTGANGGSIQPLWQWTGSFQQASTFAAATRGEAFYFLNDQGLSELTIPVGGSASSVAPSLAATSLSGSVRLSATGPEGAVSRVEVGETPDARRGLDAFDHVAPPAEFAQTAIRLRASGVAHARRQFLAREVRAPAGDGHTYTLHLQSEDAEPVTLTAHALPSRPGTQVVLIDEATDARYDLRTSPTLTLTPSSPTSTWTLLVGSRAYVASEMDVAADRLVIEPPAPNPFRDRTTIQYVLPEAIEVEIAVYDLLGRRIRTLVDDRQPNGAHTVRWNGTGSNGAPLASGMYFVRMQMGDVQQVHKVVYLR